MIDDRRRSENAVAADMATKTRATSAPAAAAATPGRPAGRRRASLPLAGR